MLTTMPAARAGAADLDVVGAGLEGRQVAEHATPVSDSSSLRWSRLTLSTSGASRESPARDGYTLR